MRKFVRPVALALLTLFSAQMLTSCFGRFSLVRAVYKFNDGIMGNDFLGRFVKNLLFYVMYFIPVYGIAAFLDLVILNLIEFWTGSNLLAMAPGQSETQFVTYKGKTYKMTGEYLKMTITDMETNKTTTLHFDANSTAVSVVHNGQMVKVADYKIEERNLATVSEMAPRF